MSFTILSMELSVKYEYLPNSYIFVRFYKKVDALKS